MRVRAHAKINLLLSVTPGADAQGYHAVETVMCPLELADDVAVEQVARPGIALACDPDPLDGAPPQGNLAYRAAAALAGALGRTPRLDIRIAKRIPSQAGLGGGSSDAAAVLRCLARLWGVDPFDPLLAAVAATLGADVAFFLHDVPTYLDGRGERVREYFTGFSRPLVLVKPPVGVSTGEAYRTLDRLCPQPLPVAGLAAALRCGDADAALAACGNNMQGAALAVAPQLAEVFSFLEGQPSLAARPLLCGSGSCVAAFTVSDQDAALVAGQAAARGWWSCATRTLA